MFKTPAGNSAGIRIDRSTFNDVQGDLNHYHITGDLHTHDGEHGEQRILLTVEWLEAQNQNLNRLARTQQSSFCRRSS